jgi:hypothetical protein
MERVHDSGSFLKSPSRLFTDGYLENRRLLTSGYSLRREDDGYANLLGGCAAFEYDAAIYVDQDTHLYAVGFPNEGATAAGCPVVATHSIVPLHNSATATKELLIWHDIEQGRNMFDKDGFVFVGTFKLADMARAFEMAEPGGSGSVAYDVVTNNCAVYLVNLASELGVKVDTRITAFVARRLLENSGSQFVESVRSSANYLSLFKGRNLRSAEAATDADVVELMVNAGASKLL